MSLARNDKFYVMSEDNDFSNRLKSTFSMLDAVVAEKEEKDGSNKSTMGQIIINAKSQRLQTKQFRGKESIFKRPEAPPPRRVNRNIPDYQRNPHKWKKYTLGDVSEEEMSEKSNTAAAMSFLAELKSRKSEGMEVDEETSKIEYSNPVKALKSDPETVKISPCGYPTENDGSCYKGSKLIMPEYVVGQKKSGKKNAKCSVPKMPDALVSKQIKLSHLNEDEENSE